MSYDGYRALAASVILRAIKDAGGYVGQLSPGDKRRSIRQSARDFLNPSNSDFGFYCDLLDLDPDALCEAIARNGEGFMAPLARRRND